MKKHLIKIGTLVLVIVGLLIFSLQVSLVYPLNYDQINELTFLRAEPKVRAFLDAIAYAEGTYGREGYKTQYTGLKFRHFDDHPRQVICSLYKGEQLCSSAAGRYQFLRATWDRVSPQISADNFGPLNQDLAALHLIVENKAIEPLLAGDFKKALERVNKVWASLPGAPYGQPTRSYEELEKVYKKRLRFHTTRLKRKSNSLSIANRKVF
jgi:muramidase (phage lysozyme)